MRYAIVYLLQDEARDWHNALAREIAEHFNIWRVDQRVPPHVTLVRPIFETDNIAPVKAYLKAWGEAHAASGTLAISDYGRFDDRVVYASVVPDATTVDFVMDLRGNVKSMLNLVDDYPSWNPHATLAHRVSSEEVEEIWKYVTKKEKPNFSIRFDAVTLLVLVDEKWQVDEIYQLKNVGDSDKSK